MRIIENYLNGRLLPSRSGKEISLFPFVLDSCRPSSTVPQWVLEVRGSHRREPTLRWYMSKIVLEEDFSDSVLLETFFLLRSEFEYSFLSVLLGERKLFSDLVGSGIPEDRELFCLLLRTYRGFVPKMGSFLFWRPNHLQPKRYVGIGYKDKGHLSEVVSIQPPEAEEPFRRRLSVFESLVRDSLRVRGIHLETLPLTDESQ